jgi:GDP-D-mannose dehydratase
VLGWKPEISFEALIGEMVDADLAALGDARAGGAPGPRGS